MVKPETELMMLSYNKIVNENEKYSDILLRETLSSVKETTAASMAADSSGFPFG